MYVSCYFHWLTDHILKYVEFVSKKLQNVSIILDKIFLSVILLKICVTDVIKINKFLNVNYSQDKTLYQGLQCFD